MTLTYLRWRDASHGMDEYDPTQMVLSDLQEIGWLVAEDEDRVVLSMEYEEGSRTRRLWLAVPKVNIIERRDWELEGLPKRRPRRGAIVGQKAA